MSKSELPSYDQVQDELLQMRNNLLDFENTMVRLRLGVNNKTRKLREFFVEKFNRNFSILSDSFNTANTDQQVIHLTNIAHHTLDIDLAIAEILDGINTETEKIGIDTRDFSKLINPKWLGVIPTDEEETVRQLFPQLKHKEQIWMYHVLVDLSDRMKKKDAKFNDQEYEYIMNFFENNLKNNLSQAQTLLLTSFWGDLSQHVFDSRLIKSKKFTQVNAVFKTFWKETFEALRNPYSIRHEKTKLFLHDFMMPLLGSISQEHAEESMALYMVFNEKSGNAVNTYEDLKNIYELTGTEWFNVMANNIRELCLERNKNRKIVTVDQLLSHIKPLEVDESGLFPEYNGRFSYIIEQSDLLSEKDSFLHIQGEARNGIIKVIFYFILPSDDEDEISRQIRFPFVIDRSKNNANIACELFESDQLDNASINTLLFFVKQAMISDRAEQLQNNQPQQKAHKKLDIQPQTRKKPNITAGRFGRNDRVIDSVSEETIKRSFNRPQVFCSQEKRMEFKERFRHLVHKGVPVVDMFEKSLKIYEEGGRIMKLNKYVRFQDDNSPVYTIRMNADYRIIARRDGNVLFVEDIQHKDEWNKRKGN